MSRTAALRNEVSYLRTHAARRVGRLEALVAQSLDEAGLVATCEQTPIRDFWSEMDEGVGRHPYSAVVDEAGTIVLHTDPSRIGRRLQRGWYERRVGEAGDDVVWIQNGPLSGESPAYDVSLPITVGSRVIGEYHEGLDGPQFEARAAAQQRAAMFHWSWLIALAALADGGAVAGLLYLLRQHRLGALGLERQKRARARELSQIGGGLAHEVRNPLHALRINLHTLRRAFSGRNALTEQQLGDTLRESDESINRLDALMRDLVQFTDPADQETVELDIAAEVQATVSLLGEELRRDEIELQLNFSAEPARVAMNLGRLRQMLLNLITFAHHRAGKRGRIAVAVNRDEKTADVTVSDNGPHMPAGWAAKLFEPFQAPAETGSGLGLALVQTYAESVGGSVDYRELGETGARLRVSLPLVRATDTGVAT